MITITKIMKLDYATEELQMSLIRDALGNFGSGNWIMAINKEDNTCTLLCDTKEKITTCKDLEQLIFWLLHLGRHATDLQVAITQDGRLVMDWNINWNKEC